MSSINEDNGNPTRLSSCQCQLEMATVVSGALGVRWEFAEQLGQCSRIGLHFHWKIGRTDIHNVNRIPGAA
ncbi:hypothetical protein ASD12_21970 [Mesorhizobium sp. Root102]|nr:hypothetical protein ASD12_21970 [Mesorhizobium sp. Root102]